MRSVVTGLMMLAGAVVREQGQGLDVFAGGGVVLGVASAAPHDGDRGADSAITVVAGPAMSVEASASSDNDEHAPEPMSVAGDWNVACVRKRGGKLMFDRGSVRDLGGATLFRWTAASSTPTGQDEIYTAVVDCRAKTIEASWPGKRSDTHAGTCGRHLVDAVCAAAPHAPQPVHRAGN